MTDLDRFLALLDKIKVKYKHVKKKNYIQIELINATGTTVYVFDENFNLKHEDWIESHAETEEG